MEYFDAFIPRLKPWVFCSTIYKLHEEVERIVEEMLNEGELEEDPREYEGVWLNCITKIKRRL